MGLALSAESHSLWDTIHREAVAVAAADPVLAAWMHEAIVNQSNLASALAQLIAVAVGGSSDEKTATRRLAERAYRDDPSLIEIATRDLRAPLDRDPAYPGALHVLLHFKATSRCRLTASRIGSGKAAEPNSTASYTAASLRRCMSASILP